MTVYSGVGPHGLDLDSRLGGTARNVDAPVCRVIDDLHPGESRSDSTGTLDVLGVTVVDLVVGLPQLVD